MKYLIILVLALASSSVFAHGHWPQTLDKYVTDSLVEIEFTLSNHFDAKTCFNIEVNGEILTPYRTCLRQGQSEKIGVWVQSEPNVETNNTVCSIAENKGSIRTRMCTSANTLFPLDYLTQ